MERCSYCRERLAASARFCPNCGQELPGYREYLSEGPSPVAPDFWQRTRLQGRASVRTLYAILAAMAASLPLWIVLADVDGGSVWALLAADVIMALAIVACALPERAELRPLWRPGAAHWWVVGAALAFALPLLAQLYVGLFDGLLEGDSRWPEMSPALLVVTLCLFPGIFEELAFRGVVLANLLHMVRPRNAHLITAAVFAGIHFSPLIFPYHFVVGLALGWLRARSGSLIPCMLCHALHNFAVTFVYA